MGNQRVMLVNPQLQLTEQRLMYLLARPEPGEEDVDPRFRLSDQSFSHGKDLDRFSHVEHQDLARFSDRGRLDGQLASFRDRREVAGDLRMRHGHRSTRPDL